ncbi:MAG: hypothetical protein MK160_05320 [Rhodobacteraceae bacterium]|nr:hypothetical protein [Paracoccaceae bacterium]
MTALAEYQRLESTGLWRADPKAQRRNVIVSLGDATLTITDVHGKVLTHWSLAAVARANPGKHPAIFHPDGDAGETLELSENEDEMVAAIERLRAVIARRRPHPGRLRFAIIAMSAALIVLGSSLWLPGALISHTTRVVPPVKRAEIGAALQARITRVAGVPCDDPGALRALERLSQRLLGQEGRLVVLPGGASLSAHLPGQTILLNRSLVEDWEDPEVTAGFILAEATRMFQRDPLRDLLDHAGLVGTLRLLTTGDLPEDTLNSYAEALMTATPAPLSDDALLQAFATAGVHSTPYAFALDITGETTLAMIEADPFAGTPLPSVIEDSDWVRLQGICGA